MKLPHYDPAHPVAMVVLPLKIEAIKNAEAHAEQRCSWVKAQLKKHKGDVNAFAPRPKGSSILGMATYQLVANLVTFDLASRMGDVALLATYDSKKAALFRKRAKEEAAIQYETFVMKLIAKIGTATQAKLEGNHVWGYSILTVVTTRSKDVERWQTRCIVNTSKYGRIFNQFPSRRIK